MPLASAATRCSIFIDSRTTTGSPARTVAPAVASTSTTVPIMGAVTATVSGIGPPCQRVACRGQGGWVRSDATKEVAMPENEWSPLRERQYEHIKEGLEGRGESEETAEEIAARTVNKERAQHGESETASRASVTDISSGRRGGLRSHSGAG